MYDYELPIPYYPEGGGFGAVLPSGAARVEYRAEDRQLVVIFDEDDPHRYWTMRIDPNRL